MVTSRPRRPRRDLTLDEIVDFAADFLADHDDGALTMRFLAEACGVTPMALYNHADDKEAILTAVVDRVLSPVATFDHARFESAREAIVEWGALFRSRLLANRGAATTYLRRPILSPTLTMVTERMFEMLARLGLDARQQAEGADALVLAITGSVANDLTRPADVRFQLLSNRAAGSAPLTAAGMEVYAVRDGEERFRRFAGWVLDGLLAEALEGHAPS
jgi:AcrR family transcriptional regulator